MNYVIANLLISLDTYENNEPIYRAEGRDDQADASAVKAAETRQALAILTAVNNGPVYPQPNA